MRQQTLNTFFALMISTIASTAGANAAAPALNFSAEKMTTLNNDTTKLTGKVVIKMGETEIRTDKAKIVTNKHKVTIYTDSFIATAKK